MAMLAAYRDGLAEPLAERRVRPDPLAGLPVGERGARAARRGRRAACDPHRPSHRRLHLAVAGRVPGPLDPPARRAAVRVRALGRAAAARVRLARRAGPQRRRHRAATGRRGTRPSALRIGRAFGLGDRFTVLTIGGIEPRKGSLTLLEGFARLRARRARARPAAGRGRRRHAVRLPPRGRPLPRAGGGARARARRARARQPRRTVRSNRLYRAADAFAFPSTKEGFGLAALEALASGLPVVASASTSSRRTCRTAAARCSSRSATATRSARRWRGWRAPRRLARGCERSGWASRGSHLGPRRDRARARLRRAARVARRGRYRPCLKPPR